MSQLKDVLTRLVNALVKALNDHQKISRFIVIIPDDDVVHHTCQFDAGQTVPFGAAVNWVANQMIHAVACEQEFLRRVKPGSVAPFEPKFVWVQMLKYDDKSSRLL